MALYKFGPHDVIRNRIKTFPFCQFVIHSGNIFYNNRTAVSGAFTSNVTLVPTGAVSLYELNVDRDERAHNFVVDTGTGVGSGTQTLIYPFIVKGSHRMSWRSVTTSEFDRFLYGDIMTGSYPLSASLLREYYHAGQPRYNRPTFTAAGEVATSGSATRLATLEHTFNYYSYLSPHYVYTSSVGGSSWDKGAQNMTLFSIPTIFYGSSIEKGSVNLKFYISGTLIGQLNDSRRNGELVQIGPPGSKESGSVAGVVLYSEGFIALTGNWDITANDKAHTEQYIAGGSAESPSWKYFGATGSTSNRVTASSFDLSFRGTEYISTMTMFAHAKKGDLNHSNNPTYIEYGQSATSPADCSQMSSSTAYKEGSSVKIKNIAKTLYMDPTGSFEKITYISKIAIYDEHKNVIAVVKLANPVKKTLEKDYTFKLKIDI